MNEIQKHILELEKQKKELQEKSSKFKSLSKRLGFAGKLLEVVSNIPSSKVKEVAQKIN